MQKPTNTKLISLNALCSLALLMGSISSHAGMVITDIVGTLEGGSLTRIATSFAGPRNPDQYNNQSTQDFIVSTAGLAFYKVEAAGSSMTLTPLNGFVYEDVGVGTSKITFTGLNGQGDNWTSIASNPFAAGNLIDSNTLEIDFAALVGAAGEITTPSVFTLAVTPVPEPSTVAFGTVTLLFSAGAIWRKRRARKLASADHIAA